MSLNIADAVELSTCERVRRGEGEGGKEIILLNKQIHIESNEV